MPRPDQEMGMVGQEGPGEDGERARLGEGGHAGDEVGAIAVIPEQGGPLDPPHHHMVQGVRRIEPRLTRHGTAAPSTRRRKMQPPITSLITGRPREVPR